MPSVRTHRLETRRSAVTTIAVSQSLGKTLAADSSLVPWRFRFEHICVVCDRKPSKWVRYHAAIINQHPRLGASLLDCTRRETQVERYLTA